MTSSDENSHSISLVDTTEPSTKRQDTLGNVPEPTRSTTGTSSKTKASRGSTLREKWTRRKYARYQAAQYAEDNNSSNDELHSERGSQSLKQDSSRHGRLRDRIPFRHKKSAATKNHQEYAVDVLYENQRGSFFCGIPLYSSNSLLNFDPSPWQTGELKDSPVNITNAQVPDPTWAWAWRRWYVDMSHDVDEEGWEYSFSFSLNFAWHGTHSLFFSFVRRRRWIRKRVKIMATGKLLHPGGLDEAHRLNSEYFTIHPAMVLASRDSSTERPAANARSSWMGSVAEKDDLESSDDEEADMDNMPALLRRLRHTTIDRKKLDALRAFLSQGNDELLTIPDAISEILNLFMYQSSRRLALQDIQSAAESLQDAVDGPSDPEKSSDQDGAKSPAPGNRRAQLKAMRAAIDAVPRSVRHLEYWSDAKELADQVEGLDFETEETAIVPAVPIGSRVKGKGSEEDVENTVSPTREDIGTGARIKGIPEKAGVGQEVGLVERLGSGKKLKEKQKEVEKEVEKVAEEDENRSR